MPFSAATPFLCGPYRGGQHALVCALCVKHRGRRYFRPMSEPVLRFLSGDEAKYFIDTGLVPGEPPALLTTMSAVGTNVDAVAPDDPWQVATASGSGSSNAGIAHGQDFWGASPEASRSEGSMIGGYVDWGTLSPDQIAALKTSIKEELKRELEEEITKKVLANFAAFFTEAA